MLIIQIFYTNTFFKKYKSKFRLLISILSLKCWFSESVLRSNSQKASTRMCSCQCLACFVWFTHSHKFKTLQVLFIFSCIILLFCYISLMSLWSHTSLPFLKAGMPQLLEIQFNYLAILTILYFQLNVLDVQSQ